MKKALLALLVLFSCAAARGADDKEAFRRRLLNMGRRYIVANGPTNVLIVAQRGYLDNASLTRFIADLDEAVRGIPALTGRPSSLRGRFTVYVYGGADDDGFMSGTGVDGASPGEPGLLLRYVKEDQAPLFHELTHMLVAGADHCDSLAEGFADFVQLRFRPGKAYSFNKAGMNADQEAADAIAGYPQPFFEAIGAEGRPGWSSQEIRFAFYHASLSFVSYLIRLKDVPTFLTVYDANGDDSAYVRAYGKTLAALRADWWAQLPPRSAP